MQGGQPAGQPAEEVEVVLALVDEDASPLAAPGAAPGRHLEIGAAARPGGEQVGALQPAEEAFAQQPVGLPDLRPGPVLVDDGQHLAVPLCLLVHAIRFGDLDRHRLLDQDVLAGPQRGDRVLGVERVRCEDHAKLGGLGYQLLDGAVRPRPELLGHRPQPIGVHVLDGDDLGADRAKRTPMEGEDLGSRTRDHNPQWARWKQCQAHRPPKA